MKKLNAVIDFNNIAFRAMFTCQYSGDSNIVNFDTDEECAILIRKMAFDISYILRLISPDRVIFACDSKSPWRNDLYENIEDMEYKGNRTKDESKNWTKIYGSFTELKEILRKKGFIVSEFENTEADDIASMWKDELYKNNGENVVLVSSDRDWTQLVDFNDKRFCVCFNPISNNKGKKKLIATESFFKWLDEPTVVDIFFNNLDESKEKMKNIHTKDPKVEFCSINPNDVLLEKILCGDDGDNVPSLYDYYKNGKKMRITQLKSKHILESLSITTVDDLISAGNSGTLKDAIEKEMKHDVEVDVIDRIKRQRTLVELNQELFPSKIRYDFSTHYSDSIDNDCVSVGVIKMDDILRGSKFFDKDYSKPKNNSVFSVIDDIQKYIKPIE